MLRSIIKRFKGRARIQSILREYLPETGGIPPPLEVPLHFDANDASTHWMVIFKGCAQEDVPRLVTAVAQCVQSIPAKLVIALPPLFILQIMPETSAHPTAPAELAESLSSCTTIECRVKTLPHSKRTAILTDRGCLEVIYDDELSKIMASACYGATESHAGCPGSLPA